MAGVDAAVLRDLLMVDVLPLAIGIEDHSMTYDMDTEQELETDKEGRGAAGGHNGGSGGGSGGGGSGGGGSGGGSTTSGSFEVVLAKGMKLPATELRTYQCEDPYQKVRCHRLSYQLSLSIN